MKARNIKGHKLIKDYKLKSGKVIKAGSIAVFDNDTVKDLKTKGFIESDKPEKIVVKKDKTEE